MSKLSEEEILDKLRKMLYHTQKANECGLSNNDFKEDIETLEGILDLYNKEKEKNKELKEKYSNKLIDFQKEREEYEKDYISKDKVREKIEEIKTIKEEHSKSFNWADWEDEDVYNEMIAWFKDLLEE